MDLLETRIPPPIVTLLFGFAMWSTAQQIPVMEVETTFRYSIAGVFLLFGLVGVVSGGISFRLAGTTVNPMKPELARNLVTSGIYRISRNPMYVGLAIILCAWSMVLGSLWLLPFVILFIIYIHRFQIIPEEKALINAFGNEFKSYKKQVRPWL